MYSEQKEALAQEIELKRPAVLAVSGLHNSGKTTLLMSPAPTATACGKRGPRAWRSTPASAIC